MGLHNDIARRIGLHTSSLEAAEHRYGPIASRRAEYGIHGIVQIRALEMHATSTMNSFQLVGLKAPLVRKNNW